MQGITNHRKCTSSLNNIMDRLLLRHTSACTLPMFLQSQSKSFNENDSSMPTAATVPLSNPDSTTNNQDLSWSLLCRVEHSVPLFRVIREQNVGHTPLSIAFCPVDTHTPVCHGASHKKSWYLTSASITTAVWFLPQSTWRAFQGFCCGMRRS